MTTRADEHSKLLFNVRRSIRYHSRRQRYFEACHRIFVFSTLMLSSFSVIALSTALIPKELSWVVLIPPAVVSLLASFDLVVGFVQKAQSHIDFVRQFTDLERRMVAPEGKEEKTIAEVQDKMLEIETTEPPVLQVLDSLCYNELLRATGYPRENHIPVSRVQRIFAQWFDIGRDRLHVPETT